MGMLGHQHEIKPAPEVGGNAQSWGETKPVALETWDSFISPREPLEIVGDVFDCDDGGGSACAIGIHLVARGWGCCLTAYNTQNSPYNERETGSKCRQG